MKSSFLTVVLGLFALASIQADTTTRWKGASTITFSGTSTLHNWSGVVPADPFTAKVTVNGSGQPVRLNAKVEVKAGSMNTAEADRDKNMHNVMQVTTFPLVTATMDAPFDKIIGPDAKVPTMLPFKLNLVGKSQQVVGTISKWSVKGETVTFDLDFQLSLKECGIKVPTVMLFINVGDTVKLHANVKLTRSN